MRAAITQMNTLAKNRTLRFASLLIIGLLVSTFALGTTPKAHAAGTISNWWPLDGRTMTGIQPFKGLLDGRAVESYIMFWQVDNGQWNRMDSNYTGYPHKEANVDVTNWKWRGSGPYVINFIAIEPNGSMIAQKSMSIYTGEIVPSAPVVLQSASTPTTTTQTSVTVAPAPAPIIATQTAVTPMPSNSLYVDPNSNAKKEIAKNPSLAPLLSKIADNSTARWFGDWNSNIATDVNNYVTRAAQANAVPVLVAYNIPGRDCGNYSAGGAGSPDAYRAWIGQLANAVGSRKAIVILEPDALALSNCLSDNNKNVRYGLIRDAVTTLKSKGNISVYIDAGHSGWISESEMAYRLNQSGIASADGFSLNVSNFETTQANTTYGEALSRLVNGKHFVIDTSRNGRGSNGEWCNPRGRGLGNKPTLQTGNPLIDAYLWVKVPGESDGTCNGGPSAGSWWLDYALELSRNASF